MVAHPALPALELRDLRKNFGKTEIIRGVNLSVGRGERVGIIGPNGAGKSTLFNLVSGRLAPSSGQVLLNGLPWGDPFYYNMRGYRGVLPLPDGSSFDPGEVSLTQLRREVAQINREAKQATPPAPDAGA